MPGAQCTRGLACKIKSTRVNHHRFTGQRRHSLRNGFNGLLRALLGDRLFCHHPRRDALGIIGRLTSASRCQDHTASPSALAAPVLRRPSVHRIPHPTSVTIAKRPSCEAGQFGSIAVSTHSKSEKFSREGLDRNPKQQPRRENQTRFRMLTPRFS
jgi:hypothetical protein